MTVRAALYARYSSDRQREASIEDQLRLCRERAAREGWQVADSYSDRSVSGASLIRPGIQALMEDAQARRFDVVLAESLDRISRDQEDIAGVYKRLSFAGVRILTLSEGEISELHVGLKGTMGALYLKDLADRTRRGLRGRVEAGRSGGGRCYGYEVVQAGDERGGRRIDPVEAEIVRRIFRDHAAGVSPRRIAAALNETGVPGPGGRAWGASTIHGNPKRGTGILNNELYVGRLVWNRLRYVKDPSTGRRVSRPNPPEDWIVKEGPELRIIEEVLWDAVKARQAASALPGRANRGAAMGGARRPRYLLSGLLQCGVCGGGMSVISASHVGCSTARNKGPCANRKTIARADLERRILGALSGRLMDPELFEVFCEEFTAETNRLRAAAGQAIAERARELAKVTRDLDRLVQAILDGAPAATVKDRMAELEARKARLEAAQAREETPPPTLHPRMAEVYRAKASDLAAALSAPEARTGAAEILRGLIEAVVLTPEAEGYAIELRGDLAGILALAAAGNDRTAGAFGPTAVSQVSLVAGARSGHDLPAEENSAEQMKLVAGGRFGLRLPFAAYRLPPINGELCLILGDTAWSSGAGFGVAGGDAVGEGDALDDLWQLVRALQAAPRLCGGLNELEDHELGRLLGQRALGADRAVPDGREDALDRVACAKVIPVFGGEGVRQASKASRSLVRQVTAFSYLVPYFSANVSTAASAAARVSACQISRRSAFTAGCMDFGNLFTTLAVLCTQQRW
jgi:DNA invertase Pin-like site-specific DNA recombinase